MIWRNSILVGDVRARLAELPDGSVQSVVTSPPYWGLRDYGAEGQIGLEATPEEYVETLVDIFREVRRVLRKDGTVWLNIGDCYVGGRRGGVGANSTLDGSRHNQNESRKAAAKRQSFRRDRRDVGDRHHKAAPALKPKDLVGQPWRVAFALQADGWYLRSDIIWSKPNPMPESVTDRPTKAHEYIFLLSKKATYYYDHEAIKEPWTSGRDDMRENGVRTGLAYLQQGPVASNHVKATRVLTTSHDGETTTLYEEGSNASRLAKLRQAARAQGGEYGDPAGRNKRSVWEVATKPYAEAHFATYPPELIKPCILAGSREGDVILDPFMGSGTTALVALIAGRDFVGIELNQDYAAMAERRIAKYRSRLL